MINKNLNDSVLNHVFVGFRKSSKNIENIKNNDKSIVFSVNYNDKNLKLVKIEDFEDYSFFVEYKENTKNRLTISFLEKRVSIKIAKNEQMDVDYFINISKKMLLKYIKNGTTKTYRCILEGVKNEI